MFTQLVMILSIVCLFWSGNKIFKRSKETNFYAGKILAAGLLFIGFSIVFYAIRDIFIQLGFNEIEIILYRIGGIFQALGTFSLIYFVFRTFSSKKISKIFVPAVAIVVMLLLVAIVFLPMESIEKESPIEIIPYRVITHPWQSKPINIFFLGSILFFSIIILFIFLFNISKEKNNKKNTKSLFYGLGILFLFSPAILCVFISPIFARIGYVIGAFLIYKAFDIEI